MRCPVDKTKLWSKIYEADIRVDACPACGGMWLDRGELEAIQESKERDYSEELARMPNLGYNAYKLAQQKVGRTLQCPKCNIEMEAREYARCSQVMIDVCPKCHGIWLDKGEIEALEIFFERSRFKTQDIRQAFLASLRSVFK
jgi:Zn-finger nucleic acid-binding protein